MTAWGCEHWIEVALKQAISMCDEVLVSVGAHSISLEKFEDGTLDLCKNYPVSLVDVVFKNNHSTTKAATMNSMLQYSELYEEGNWIWLLDADEFYFDDEILRIKKIIESGKYNAIETNEKFFFVNMTRYLKSNRMRLWRIENTAHKFTPTNNWPGRNPYHIDGHGMFHYSMLQNPYMKRDFWSTEYNSPQKNKIKWLDSYLEDNYNFDMFIKGGMKTDNGDLFVYTNNHPKLIEESPLIKIRDFRKFYKNG